jgi:hypothetical protein
MLENHMVIGAECKPEPEKTEIECFCCGEKLFEGENYKVFTRIETENEVVICEDCLDCTKLKTAWNN